MILKTNDRLMNDPDDIGLGLLTSRTEFIGLTKRC